jgi:hypothetical protein
MKEKKTLKIKKIKNISLKNSEFFTLVKGLSINPFEFFDASPQPTNLGTSSQNLR